MAVDSCVRDRIQWMGRGDRCRPRPLDGSVGTERGLKSLGTSEPDGWDIGWRWGCLAQEGDIGIPELVPFSEEIPVPQLLLHVPNTVLRVIAHSCLRSISRCR